MNPEQFLVKYHKLINKEDLIKLMGYALAENDRDFLVNFCDKDKDAETKLEESHILEATAIVSKL